MTAAQYPNLWIAIHPTTTAAMLKREEIAGRVFGATAHWRDVEALLERLHGQYPDAKLIDEYTGEEYPEMPLDGVPIFPGYRCR